MTIPVGSGHRLSRSRPDRKSPHQYLNLQPPSQPTKHCSRGKYGFSCRCYLSLTKLAFQGFLWGASPSSLLSHLPASSAGFDVLILADLLFNHSEHAKLISSIQQTLRKEPHTQALVFFTPYRPWLLEKDLAFFDLARNGGFRVDKVLEKVMEKVMFDEDPGVSTFECLEQSGIALAECVFRMNCSDVPFLDISLVGKVRSNDELRVP